MLSLETCLKRVLAIYLRKVIRDLDRRGDLIRGQEGITAQRLQATNAQSGQPTIFVQLGNALNSKLPRKIRQVIGLGDIAGCMQIIQSRASNVHSRWGKRMRPYQSTLLGQCRLITLEESASIGNAAENTRDQFRSVY